MLAAHYAVRANHHEAEPVTGRTPLQIGLNGPDIRPNIAGKGDSPRRLGAEHVARQPDRTADVVILLFVISNCG